MRSLPATEDTTFQIADLLVSVENYEEAIEALDKVVAKDQRTLQSREQLVLTLAERIGDVDRARKAAERLFGLRLSSKEQLELLPPLRRLGMSDLADAILARAERSAGNQVSAFVFADVAVCEPRKKR